MDTPNIELEQSVEDNITGFAGVVTAILNTLNEPTLYLVENDTGHKWLPEARILSKVTA